jgi:DNA-binding transcriptional ArsR family regulator
MDNSLPPEKNQLVINEIEIRKARLVLRALNHKLRQRILQYIHSKKETPVTPLYESLLLEQSVASQHLAILRKAGFVTTRRDGKQVNYSVNYLRIEEVQTLVNNFLLTGK